MSTGSITEWADAVPDVTVIYPLPGAVGLWVAIAVVFLIWWVIAFLRTEQLSNNKIAEDFSDPHLLKELLDVIDGEQPEE